jgi:hypothetical protein
MRAASHRPRRTSRAADLPPPPLPKRDGQKRLERTPENAFRRVDDDDPRGVRPSAGRNRVGFGEGFLILVLP